jgi:uncharacterized protein YcfL
MKKIINYALIIVLSSFFLFACGKKKEVVKTDSPQEKVTRTFDLTDQLTPDIQLTPRSDGKELKLTISQIDPSITQIEYELIYSATSEGMEVEKGLGDTLNVEGDKLERDLLLGTASCTTGTCKYKYDDGVTGGSIGLILINDKGQSASINKDFSLTQDPKTKKFSITFTDDISPTSSTQ